MLIFNEKAYFFRRKKGEEQKKTRSILLNLVPCYLETVLIGQPLFYFVVFRGLGLSTSTETSTIFFSMKASISVICYKYKTLSNGESPLMLRIHKDGKRKLVSIGLSIHPQLWDFTKNEPKPKCPNKDLINKIILDKKAEYQKEILELNAEQKDYTASSLVENKKAKYEPKTVIDFYKELIQNFKDAGKTGNKSIYTNSLNSLKAFTHNKLNILFSDIDVDWLKRYEKWQRSNKNKETTISLQFRTLRSAYNKAIEAKATSAKSYPFKAFNINRFNTKTRKRSLSKEEIMRIITTETVNATYIRQLTRDIFKFSYLCAGIPFVDIANLTMENINRQNRIV